jgi:hypothetical protein
MTQINETSIVPVLTPRLHFKDAHKNNQNKWDQCHQVWFDFFITINKMQFFRNTCYIYITWPTQLNDYLCILNHGCQLNNIFATKTKLSCRNWTSIPHLHASHPEGSNNSRLEDDAPWMGGLLWSHKFFQRTSVVWTTDPWMGGLLCGVTSSSKGPVWSGLQIHGQIPWVIFYGFLKWVGGLVSNKLKIFYFFMEGRYYGFR